MRRRAVASAAVTGVWPDDAVRAEALAWVGTRLDQRGMRRCGEIEEVRRTAWSWAVRVPVDGGDVWFKATNGGTRYEAALTVALARLVPGRVLVPLAVDVARAWQLLPDGGPTVRAATDGLDARRWEGFLSGYAELQRTVAPHVTELIGLGTPDMRPEVMPARLDAFLADPPPGLSAEAHARLLAVRPEYRRWCQALADGGIAASVQHDDLHDANVFVTGDRIFDWGDASVAHPFASLLVSLRSLAYKLGVAADDPAVLRVRDAYLDAWSAEHDVRHLREQARLATGVAKVARAAAWQRALVAATPADLEDSGEAVAGWLAELLEPGPL